MSWVGCYWGKKRVLKWSRHKNEISEIIGFVRIFWKNNVLEAYLPKMSISGQIVSEIERQQTSNIKTTVLQFTIIGKLLTYPSPKLTMLYVNDRAQSFVSVGKLIVMEEINGTCLLVNKIKMLRMLLNIDTVSTKTYNKGIWQVS